MKTINSIKSAIKSVILAALVAAVGVNISTSVSASTTQYAPRNATESVFFSHGYVEAYAEGEAVVNSISYRASFLSMAWANAALAQSLSLINASGDYNPAVAYFSGRVAAFLALAEIYGE